MCGSGLDCRCDILRSRQSDGRNRKARPLQSDDGARDTRLIRLSTRPAKVAPQARTATTMNRCDSGSRNVAARIFAKWYVETKCMPSGNTLPIEAGHKQVA